MSSLSTRIETAAQHFVQIVLTKCFDGEPLRVFDLASVLSDAFPHYNIPDNPVNRARLLDEVKRLALCARVSSENLLNMAI